MDLWIRNQDKEKLIKIDNIEIQHHYSYKDAQKRFLLPNGGFEYRKVPKKDKYIESVIMCNDEICLGKYNSKKRTLELLDEIQYLLNNNFCYNKELGQYITCNNAIYEMPKE